MFASELHDRHTADARLARALLVRHEHGDQVALARGDDGKDRVAHRLVAVRSRLPQGGGRLLRWWTWAGYRANATLAATLRSVTDPLQRPTDNWLRLRENLTPAEWRTARENVGEHLVLPDVDHRAVRGLKFSAALPERLAVATVAARLADFESARSVLGEPARFQLDG